MSTPQDRAAMLAAQTLADAERAVAEAEKAVAAEKAEAERRKNEGSNG
jgi:hypothetical protein